MAAMFNHPWPNLTLIYFFFIVVLPFQSLSQFDSPQNIETFFPISSLSPVPPPLLPPSSNPSPPSNNSSSSDKKNNHQSCPYNSSKYFTCSWSFLLLPPKMYHRTETERQSWTSQSRKHFTSVSSSSDDVGGGDYDYFG